MITQSNDNLIQIIIRLLDEQQFSNIIKSKNLNICYEEG